MNYLLKMSNNRLIILSEKEKYEKMTISDLEQMISKELNFNAKIKYISRGN